MSPEHLAAKSLGQEIGPLVLCGHINKLNCGISHHVANPVELDVNVLQALVVDLIFRKRTSGLVVDVDTRKQCVLQQNKEASDILGLSNTVQ
jgi:hypothetical protein